MALDVNDDDKEFGLNSSDEAELIALADSSVQGTKRKAPFSDNAKPQKRPALDSSPISKLALAALVQNFGHKAFRLEQEQVIMRIMAGGSAVVVFPTGSGKSLCYQLPALLFSQIDKLSNVRGTRDGGLTLVVSPLLALMKDQMDALFKLGIAAAAIDAYKTRAQILDAFKKLRKGKLRLLYCSPERLNHEGFVEEIKRVRGGIRLLAVDEAHCISEWGHSFRPDYLKIARFFAEIKAERVICLTATATPRVAKDICNAFNIEEAGLFRTSSYRPNLRILAESVKTKRDIYPRLFNFLLENPGSSIVYVAVRKQAEFLAAELKDQGFHARAFHAGMDVHEKTTIQDQFMRSNDLIIVATISFAMGINKENIRNVVHFNIPSSIESYIQQIGRAGRDGKISKCMFYICSEDLHLREIFARGPLPSRKSVHRLLREIFNPMSVKPVGGEIKASHHSQTKNFDIQKNTLENIYAHLELHHGLIRENTPTCKKYSFKASHSYQSTLEKDDSPAANAVKRFARFGKSLYSINVGVAADRMGIPRIDVVLKLNDWDETEIIELRFGGSYFAYKILKTLPQIPAEFEKLVSEIYNTLLMREQEALDQTEQILNLITSKACFSRSLAQHLGDDLPNGRKECRHCTWCLTHQAVVKYEWPPVPFDQASFENILNKIKDRDDARFLARVAFGINSPRATRMKICQDPLFSSMSNHDFMVLLRAFTSVCCKAK